jgi:amidase
MKKLRIAFARRCFSGQEADPEQVAAVERLARIYEELGHDVFEREPVLDWHAYVEGLFVIVVAGVHAAIRGACQVSGLVPGSEKMEPYLWATYERGAKFSSGDLLRAWSLLAASQRQIGRFFEDVDMLLTPVLNGSPIRAGLAEAVTDMDTFWQQFSCDALSPFTGIFNVTGQPAASIPALFPEGGIPIGVQAVTRFGREDTLFSVSRQIEEASPWSHQRPSLHASDA